MGATGKGHSLLISLYRKALRVPQFVPFVAHTHTYTKHTEVIVGKVRKNQVVSS